MPRVADYSILTDNWWVEGRDPDPIQFDVPDNIDAGSRSILSFMVFTDSIEDMGLKIRVNGTPVWDWHYPNGDPRLHHFQEVIPKGLVKPGSNNLSLETTSGDFRFTKISDVVIWWQANI